jgi:oligopeptide/dipeptide ABC transporter ATP-binding protein
MPSKQKHLLEIAELSIDLLAPDGAVNLVSIESLVVNPADRLGIVGESGSGKSLTLRAILGVLPRDIRATGRVAFRGRDLLDLNEKRLRHFRGREISMVFQEPMTALNPTMRIGDQIAEGPRRRKELSRRQAQALAVELLRQVGVPDPTSRVRQFPHELSGGQRQRVVIAIALASRPALLLCDEPTTALDATIQKQVLELLRSLSADLELAIVLVTHDLGVVAQTCQRTAVMYAGSIVEQGPTEAVLRAPRHPYTLALLRAVPSASGQRTRSQGISGVPPEPRARPSGCPFHPRCGYRVAQCSSLRPPVSRAAKDWSVACFQSPIDDPASH